MVEAGDFITERGGNVKFTEIGKGENLEQRVEKGVYSLSSLR